LPVHLFVGSRDWQQLSWDLCGAASESTFILSRTYQQAITLFLVVAAMLHANSMGSGGLKFPVLHPLMRRGEMGDLSVKGISRGHCSSSVRNKTRSDSALVTKDLRGELKKKGAARHNTGETFTT